jgi:hypothetical protein
LPPLGLELASRYNGRGPSVVYSSVCKREHVIRQFITPRRYCGWKGWAGVMGHEQLPAICFSLSHGSVVVRILWEGAICHGNGTSGIDRINSALTARIINYDATSCRPVDFTDVRHRSGSQASLEHTIIRVGESTHGSKASGSFKLITHLQIFNSIQFIVELHHHHKTVPTELQVPANIIEVKNTWSCTATPPYASMTWSLMKDNGNVPLLCLK